MTEKTYREALTDALFLEMRRDKDVFVMGEDVVGGTGSPHAEPGFVGGVFGVTGGLHEEFGLDSGEFDVEISDQITKTDQDYTSNDIEIGFDFQMGDSLNVDLGDGVNTQVETCESCPPGNPIMFAMMGHVIAGTGEDFADEIADEFSEQLSDSLIDIFDIESDDDRITLPFSKITVSEPNMGKFLTEEAYAQVVSPTEETVAVTAPVASMNPPRNLTAMGVGYTADLHWAPPAGSDQWITNSNPEIGNALGSDAAFDFQVASRFTAPFLVEFQGKELREVEFMGGSNVVASNYIIQVHKAGVGGQNPVLIYESDIIPGTELEELAPNWHMIEPPIQIGVMPGTANPNAVSIPDNVRYVLDGGALR